MGNQPSRPSTALDSYVEELGSDVVYEKSIGTSRFLKTIKAKHTNGPLLIKIFFKPQAPQGISLAAHRRRLKAEREALVDVPNVHPYQAIFESEKAAYLVRQFLASDLYDRISTRPFLSDIEKKWFTYQILVGMSELRSRKVSHGNLKPSNVLVTSSNWIYITDLSPFKPVYLPEDNPADFDFFFDTSSRRSCYLAPERFFAAGSKAELRRAESDWQDGQRDGKVTEEMDVFSAGCTIAELWLDGKDVFNLSGMLAWREGKSSPEGVISEITDPLIQTMVRSMLFLDPADRPSFDHLLATNRSTTFPEFFYTFFHQYNLTLNEIQSPAQLLRPSSGTELEEPSLGGDESRDSYGEADWRIERVRKDLDSIKSYLDVDSADGTDGTDASEMEDGPALLVLALITSNVRASFRPSSKVHALEVATELSAYLTDETKLDRLVPFVVALLRDDAPGVRAAAMRTLTTLLDTVESVSLSNAAIVTEYILPNAWHLAKDEDVSVRTAYATAVSCLADVGTRFLEISESLRTQGGQLGPSDVAATTETTYEECQDELHRIIQSEVTSLLYDPSSSVKRAVLVNITSFCIFFGRVKTNEVLLSHMFTYLNDSDWQLRYSFFESIVGVAAFVGSTSLEAFIFPLMTQAVSDAEESVVARVLASLRSLAELDLFSKPRLWELLSLSLGLVVHPNVWIRQAAVGLIASTSRRLSRPDTWCLLYAHLSLLMRSEIGSVSEDILLGAVLPPVPRPIYDSAFTWAKKAARSPFWTIANGSESQGRLFADLPTQLASTAEEDQAQIAALRQKGLLPADDKKVLALRSHISRVARASSSLRELSESDSTGGPLRPDLGVLSLIRLSVTPQTVFINPRPGQNGDTSRRVRRKASTRSTSGGHTSLRPQALRLTSVLSSAAPSAPPSVLSAASPLPPMPSIPASISIPKSSRPPPDVGAISPSAESILSLTSLAESSSRPRPFSTVAGGVMEPKSAASVGAVRTNAVGRIESSSVIRGDDSEADPSDARSSTPVGRGSPSATGAYVESSNKASAFPSITGYDGSDSGIRSLIEAIYLETFRDPLPELGPRISSRRPQGSRTASGSRPIPSSTASTSSDPILICHLHEHQGPISGLLVSPDNAFFVSAAQDELVKVWDTARLERNTTTKPRLTHKLGTRPTAMRLLESSHCIAVAGEDGSVVVLRVHIHAGTTSLKFKEIEAVRYFQLDRQGEVVVAMSHIKSDTANDLLLLTSQSSLLVLSLHSMHITKLLHVPLHLGAPTVLCSDPRRLWVIVGTLDGYLTLWDMRFGILLRTWRVAGKPVRQVVVHPFKGGGRYVIVASGGGEEVGGSAGETVMETWSIEGVKVVELFKVGSSATSTSAVPSGTEASSTSPTHTSAAEADPAQAIANLLFSSSAHRTPPPPPKRRDRPSNNVLAIVASPSASSSRGQTPARSRLAPDGWSESADDHTRGGAGVLWVGGEDRLLRRLDLSSFSKSTVFGAGPSSIGDGVTFSSQSQSQPPLTVHQETPDSSASSRPPLEASTAHSDSIVALATVTSPSSTYLVSGDRSGVLRIWRV